MKRASILVITLWTLCLLATFALYLGYAVRQKIILTQQITNWDNLHFIAEAGVKRAIMELNKDDPLSPDALKDSWSNNISIFKDIAAGNGKFSIFYGSIDPFKNIKETFFGVVDEESKININTADELTLRRLFIIFGLGEVEAQELAACIIDWRDKDSQLSIPLGSAEDSFYWNLPEPYEAKDSNFEALSELLLVKGVTQEVFDRIKDFITIYGLGKVNINTASSQVLSALGLDEELINKIIAFRYGKDAILRTEDDGIFTAPVNLSAQLSQFYRLSDTEAVQLDNLALKDIFSVTSDNFMIKSRASFNNGASPKHQIICVARRSGEILSYVEF